MEEEENWLDIVNKTQSSHRILVQPLFFLIVCRSLLGRSGASKVVRGLIWWQRKRRRREVSCKWWRLKSWWLSWFLATYILNILMLYRLCQQWNHPLNSNSIKTGLSENLSGGQSAFAKYIHPVRNNSDQIVNTERAVLKKIGLFSPVLVWKWWANIHIYILNMGKFKHRNIYFYLEN